MDHPEGFRELLRQAQASGRQEAGLLLAAVRPWLEQLARNYADPKRPDESASDLAQEAWLRAWQKLDQFRGDDGDEQCWAQFRAWLSQIVHRLGLNARRDREAQRRTPPGPVLRAGTGGDEDSSGQGRHDPEGREPTPSANLQAEERLRAIRSSLERITDAADREILRLRFFDGWSLRQIARHLGLNHERVRQRYHALLERLERELKELL